MLGGQSEDTGHRVKFQIPVSQVTLRDGSSYSVKTTTSSVRSHALLGGGRLNFCFHSIIQATASRRVPAPLASV